MVLLYALKTLSAAHQWKMVIAHFNHRLRGRASNADEKLVRKVAAKLKLPAVVESADVKSFAKKSKLSVEMAARKLRHEFLARTAKNQKIKTIALAHHADDQVELFFLRLFRGAGGEGLSGMKWKSPSAADKTISLVRPLLVFSKIELLEFAKQNKIRFRDDATNLSSDFLRNRIRNELLPLLRKNYQPALNKTIFRVMEILGAESEFIGRSSERELAQIRDQRRLASAAVKRNFENLSLAIQRRVLQTQLLESGIVADFDLIESLRRSPDQFISVGANISVARNPFGEIQLREDLKPGFNSNERLINLAGSAGVENFSGAKFDWKIFRDGERGFMQNKNQSRFMLAATKLKREFFDADKIGGKIILRHWQPGDRFQPIGMKSPKKLQDLFVNAKIPHARRRHLVLATAESGEIFWVEGLRISENFKVAAQTERQLVWEKASA